MSAETLAKVIVEDLGLPTSYELDIANQVKAALLGYKKARLALGGSQAHYGSRDETDARLDKEKYCTVVLDLQAEGVRLRDQFEWDIYNSRSSPAEFAKVLVDDLGLPPCFERLVNFEISRQVR